MTAEEEQSLSKATKEEYSRLRTFVYRWVADRADAEVLQDVFYDLAEAYHSLKTIEQVTAWLFRVARNRITSRFRKGKREAFADGATEITDDEGELSLEELLPSSEQSPESAYPRSVLLEELEAAVDELPEEQRESSWLSSWRDAVSRGWQPNRG